MADSRHFKLATITRKDLMSLTEDCAKVTGIPYVMDSYRKEAEETPSFLIRTTALQRERFVAETLFLSYWG
jgi:hypothetical protein